MSYQDARMNTYCVRLGLAGVTVHAQSKVQAIAIARRQLAAELPRFYDVIYKADSRRFDVGGSS